MLMIRFQRVGRKNDPAFRVVLTEKRSKPKSGEIEILGSFHSKTKETRLEGERISYWLSKGAKLSPRVHNLLIDKGIIQGAKVNVVKKRVALPPTPTEAATPAAAETTATKTEVPPAGGGAETGEPEPAAAVVDTAGENQ